MLPEEYAWIAAEFEPEGDPWRLLGVAQTLEEAGNLGAAATVYDRAYGLDPAAEEIRQGRGRVLEGLAVVEHGLRFCYIPGGVFLMGCNGGEPDERPWHPVWLSPYWMSETPISWAAYCRLLDWEPPPAGRPHGFTPQEFDRDPEGFFLLEHNKIRLQYCEDLTTRALQWPCHTRPEPHEAHQRSIYPPPRTDPDAPWQYETKPVVAVSWHNATQLADHLSTKAVRFALPTEAQWEKAARGGLIGARHAWGNEPPTHERCDFDRFREVSILPMKTFPPNGYGLYAVNGGVWEWTRDWYDRDFYADSPQSDPEGPPDGEERVLRGGAWSDCADVVTTSFRMARDPAGPDTGWGLTPNIGFRLCRTVI